MGGNALNRFSAASRTLFVATILTGSFLLFLVQPMVARMALPRLGGAPNVWNSAMLVYQALLLAGYGYAHLLSRYPVRKQATIHLALLVVAALTLPIALIPLDPPAPGSEVFWVPMLFALSIGPVFLLVSAQAPLMQRWYAASPDAGDPYALYAASNLGSFAGLIAYPLLAEPLLSLHAQSWSWTIGYGLLLILIMLAARARWQAGAVHVEAQASSEKVSGKRIAQWLALSAVPSGLMLSTTTHLTTDIFAMPLLWVIPLGLYLLSFTLAFAERRNMAGMLMVTAPLLLLLTGGTAMTSSSTGSMSMVIAGVLLLFVLCVTLHARLYDLRPGAEHLTLFYFVMSVGGALGGLFCALIAPLAFDWAWEHPILVLAAALLLPLPAALDWRRIPGLEPGMARLAQVTVFALAMGLCWLLWDARGVQTSDAYLQGLSVGVALCGYALSGSRLAFMGVLLPLMLVNGGVQTVKDSMAGVRSRSYFGIYTVRDYAERNIRTLTHGTTLHGEQSLDPAARRLPLTYYGPGSGAGIAFSHAGELYGPGARLAVVGLGTGSLACYARPGEQLHYFEIDPTVLDYSRRGTFSFIRDCAPQAKVTIGDARIELAKVAPASFDVLAVDAFSSDAIPLHLLTDEAFGVYMRALSPNGVLLVHISNRYIELQPVLAAAAKKRGLVALLRDDVPPSTGELTASSWVLLALSKAPLDFLARKTPAMPLRPLTPPAAQPWTDDHASILPYIRWQNMLGKPGQ